MSLNVLVTGDVRNDLYFTLKNGEFDKGSKSVGRNVEVKIKAYNGGGDLILVSSTFTALCYNFVQHGTKLWMWL